MQSARRRTSDPGSEVPLEDRGLRRHRISFINSPSHSIPYSPLLGDLKPQTPPLYILTSILLSLPALLPAFPEMYAFLFPTYLPGTSDLQVTHQLHEVVLSLLWMLVTAYITYNVSLTWITLRLMSPETPSYPTILAKCLPLALLWTLHPLILQPLFDSSMIRWAITSCVSTAIYSAIHRRGRSRSHSRPPRQVDLNLLHASLAPSPTALLHARPTALRFHILVALTMLITLLTIMKEQSLLRSRGDFSPRHPALNFIVPPSLNLPIRPVVSPPPALSSLPPPSALLPPRPTVRILVLIMSAWSEKGAQLRNTFRATSLRLADFAMHPASSSFPSSSSPVSPPEDAPVVEITHRFLLGTPSSSYARTHLRDAILEESDTHGDLLLLPVSDQYVDLSRKLFAGMEWSVSPLAGSWDYLIKTDDDIFARIDTISSDLSRLHPQPRLWQGQAWWGIPPVTGTQGRHVAADYDLGIYPPFTSGALTTLSRDVVLRLVSSGPARLYTRNEDQSLGVWLYSLGYRPRNDRRVQQEDVCEEDMVAKHFADTFSPGPGPHGMLENILHGRPLCSGFRRDICAPCYPCAEGTHHYHEWNFACDPDRGITLLQPSEHTPSSLRLLPRVMAREKAVEVEMTGGVRVRGRTDGPEWPGTDAVDWAGVIRGDVTLPHPPSSTSAFPYPAFSPTTPDDRTSLHGVSVGFSAWEETLWVVWWRPAHEWGPREEEAILSLLVHQPHARLRIVSPTLSPSITRGWRRLGSDVRVVWPTGGKGAEEAFTVGPISRRWWLAYGSAAIRRDAHGPFNPSSSSSPLSPSSSFTTAFLPPSDSQSGGEREKSGSGQISKDRLSPAEREKRRLENKAGLEDERRRSEKEARLTQAREIFISLSLVHRYGGVVFTPSTVGWLASPSRVEGPFAGRERLTLFPEPQRELDARVEMEGDIEGFILAARRDHTDIRSVLEDAYGIEWEDGSDVRLGFPGPIIPRSLPAQDPTWPLRALARLAAGAFNRSWEERRLVLAMSMGRPRKSMSKPKKSKSKTKDASSSSTTTSSSLAKADKEDPWSGKEDRAGQGPRVKLPAGARTVLQQPEAIYLGPDDTRIVQGAWSSSKEQFLPADWPIPLLAYMEDPKAPNILFGPKALLIADTPRPIQNASTVEEGILFAGGSMLIRWTGEACPAPSSLRISARLGGVRTGVGSTSGRKAPFPHAEALHFRWTVGATSPILINTVLASLSYAPSRAMREAEDTEDLLSITLQCGGTTVSLRTPITLVPPS